MRRHPSRNATGPSATRSAAWHEAAVEAIVLDIDESGRPIDLLRGAEADAYERIVSGGRNVILVYEGSKTYRIVPTSMTAHAGWLCSTDAPSTRKETS